MASNEQVIWQFLKSKGLTDAGAAGLMGNLEAESGLSPINLQQKYERSLGYSDNSYTSAVDSGKYSRYRFVNDKAGYGLAQWTYYSRKEDLYDYAKSQGKSIGDLNMQLNFLIIELESTFPSVLKVLKSTNSIKEASNKVLFDFEAPEDQSYSVQALRARAGQGYYDKYANGKIAYQQPQQEPIQINIVQKTSTHNTTWTPGRSLSYIVIHYTAGVHSRAGAAKNTASYFASSAPASSDFIVDDVDIVQYNPDIENRKTWHCGGGRQSSQGGSVYGVCTNSNSIGIEVCSSNYTGKVTNANDKNWYYTDAVIEQTILLTKYLMQTYNIDIDHVVRHYDVTGKWCPGIIGWNSASGDESKWLAFKASVSSASNLPSTGEDDDPSTGEDDEIKEEEIFKSYAARVIVFSSSQLNCHVSPDANSEVVKTYSRNDILAISEEQNGWGYTGAGWVTLANIKKVSVSEGIITYILSGYDKLKFDELTGEIIYPLDGWNSLTDGGFKYFASDDLVKALLEIRQREDNSDTAIETKEFVKNLIIGLEESVGYNKEYCQEKIRLLMKSAIETKKTLAPSSSSILIRTAADAFTNISEEHILEKLDSKEGKQDIIDYFQKTYDEQGWNKNIQTSPESLNFWFDFMETEGDMGKYSVKAIGNRSKAINDDKVTAIYYQETPTVMFLTPEEYDNNLKNYNDMSGYTLVRLQPFMENYFTISAQGKSAKDELDNLLYQHTCASENVTLTAVPIHHLQPNTRVFIKDDNTGVNGDYIINKITIPLQYNGTTSITAKKAIERIY